MNMAEIIGKRIDELRKSNDITQEKLAEIINVSRPTLISYLKGEQVIDSGKLFTLAKYFNKSLEYFLGVESEEILLMFRADNPLKNFDEHLQDVVTKKIKDYCDIIEIAGEKISFVPESYNLKLSSTKTLNDEELDIIESIAHQQREAFGIADIVPDNLYKCFEDKGIRVIAQALGTDKISSISSYSEEYGCFIFINDDSNIPEERKFFSLAHELGHLIFHRNEYNKGTDALKYAGARKEINEKVANEFASRFLIPSHLVRKFQYLLKRPITLQSVLELKKQFRVSAKAMIYALEKYGYINKSQCSTMFRRLTQMGLAKKEPMPLHYIEKTQAFQDKIKYLYLQESLSISKVATLLNCSIRQTMEKARGWNMADGDSEEIF